MLSWNVQFKAPLVWRYRVLGHDEQGVKQILSMQNIGNLQRRLKCQSRLWHVWALIGDYGIRDVPLDPTFGIQFWDTFGSTAPSTRYHEVVVQGVAKLLFVYYVLSLFACLSKQKHKQEISSKCGFVCLFCFRVRRFSGGKYHQHPVCKVKINTTLFCKDHWLHLWHLWCGPTVSEVMEVWEARYTSRLNRCPVYKHGIFSDEI